MPKLTIVPTPIGNLSDITIRAKEALANCDTILCEDTRVTYKLINLLGLPNKPLVSFHAHNEHKQLQKVISILENNESTCLVCDAGMPGISDPCYLLVKECKQKNITTEVLPGASSILPALVNSGLPPSPFYFQGFLPPKKGRQTLLKNLSQLKCTIAIFESPFKVLKTLEDLKLHFSPTTPCVLAREISKIHEEYIGDTVEECLTKLKEKPSIKGEFVIILYTNG